MEKLGGKGSDGNMCTIGTKGSNGSISPVNAKGCTGPVFYIPQNSDGSFDHPNSGCGGICGLEKDGVYVVIPVPRQGE